MNRYRKPHRYKKKKSIFSSKAFWLVIFSALLVFGIFYLICFSSFVQIKEVKISGNQKISAEAIKEIVKKRSEKNILFFPTQSIFLADLNQMSKDVLEKFLLIGEVKLKRNFFNTLAVDVSERKPVAVLLQGENIFNLDEEGIIFEKAFLEDGLTMIIDRQKTNNLGEKAIDKEKLSQILDINSRLKSDLNISIQWFEIESDDKINLAMSEGWQAYFDLQKDVSWQFTKLKAVLEEKIPPGKRGDLEYIELRFGNFAPFKYKDQSIL
ncbi:MAG: FtsQ-type POTRA domain-containing protein [Candidatus Nealsonbacteria bacterium]|nr:FtsQ-type POTRA domain-containing protein [Candidatus Nealsonbacteria bacterium]